MLDFAGQKKRQKMLDFRRTEERSEIYDLKINDF
jgi:hypothetical protein